jgi:hypothetical protein
MDRQRHLRALSSSAAVVAVLAAAGPFAGCGRRSVGDGAGSSAERAVDDDAAAPLVRLQPTRVFVANHGKLVGAFNGFAWVAGAAGVRIDAPNPCNERACFRGTDGMLCARGALPDATRCDPSRADGRCLPDPWAVKIGLDVHREGGPWGPSAKPYVSIDYRGARYLRLGAHRVGDGSREYCVDHYVSGDLVRAERFRAECWRDGGDTLTSFEDVDKFVLELPADAPGPAFDYCITAIDVADPIDAAAGAPAPEPEPRVRLTGK